MVLGQLEQGSPGVLQCLSLELGQGRDGFPNLGLALNPAEVFLKLGLADQSRPQQAALVEIPERAGELRGGLGPLKPLSNQSQIGRASQNQPGAFRGGLDPVEELFQRLLLGRKLGGVGLGKARLLPGAHLVPRPVSQGGRAHPFLEREGVHREGDREPQVGGGVIGVPRANAGNEGRKVQDGVARASGPEAPIEIPAHHPREEGRVGARPGRILEGDFLGHVVEERVEPGRGVRGISRQQLLGQCVQARGEEVLPLLGHFHERRRGRLLGFGQAGGVGGQVGRGPVFEKALEDVGRRRKELRRFPFGLAALALGRLLGGEVDPVLAEWAEASLVGPPPIVGLFGRRLGEPSGLALVASSRLGGVQRRLEVLPLHGHPIFPRGILVAGDPPWRRLGPGPQLGEGGPDLFEVLGGERGFLPLGAQARKLLEPPHAPRVAGGRRRAALGRTASSIHFSCSGLRRCPFL